MHISNGALRNTHRAHAAQIKLTIKTIEISSSKEL